MRKVSVIISTYNRSQLLREAIESVLAQTYPNVELIVADDCSMDNTREVVAQYGERVRWVRTERNSGQAATRNAGLRIATGEYIAFLDDDDTILSDKIQEQVCLLDARPELGLALCRFYHTDQNGRYVDRSGLMPEGNVLARLAQGCFIESMNIPLARLQCYERVGEFDLALPTSTDFDMWLRMALAGFQFGAVQKFLCTYRLHVNNLTRNSVKLEHGAIANLDKLYANPLLPADVVALKDNAYSNMRFWISTLHYGAGRWADAERNLEQAIALNPGLRDPQNLSQALCGVALGARVADPVSFITTVMDHLPSSGSILQPLKAGIVGYVHAGTALRYYARGETAEAQRHMAAAVERWPELVRRRDDFAGLLAHSAMQLPVESPVAFVETVFRNLPASARALATVQARVLSHVHAACAFEAYAVADRANVRQHVWNAVRYRPATLRNRGMLAILIKSRINSHANNHHHSLQQANIRRE